MSDDEESCFTRQMNERDVLKAIYGDQLVFISEAKKPLECILHLWGNIPVCGSPDSVPRLDLHVRCPEQYPVVSPSVRLENWKKVPNEDIRSLRKALVDITDTRKGEVVIHELAQHCENFLYNLDSTDFGSLYEGMMQRNRDLEETRAKELQKRKEDEERKRAEILDHIQSQQQAVKKALRRKSKSETVEDDNEDVFQQEMETVVEKYTMPTCSSQPEQPIGDNDAFTPWDLLTHGHGRSRFENDFELIKKLGEGAFGEVVKVQNRLDGGFYAIKRIELNPSMRQLNRITREVKLLSCLNHENVVRYYNSWVEIANADKLDSGTSEDEKPSNFQRPDVLNMLPCGHDITLRWDEPKEENDDSDSDWLVFGNGSDHSSGTDVSSPAPIEQVNLAPKPLLFMYIQMELCEKSTLRIAIDEGLHKNSNRVWRLFREIVEGLCHIHGQGIMHRDLKPVNIFLGNNDQVKIGDFGLATTSKPAKPVPVNRDACDAFEPSEDANMTDSFKKDGISHTGAVGTALYVAPELDNSVPRPFYNQKVDVYSLGIIFFEMTHPLFNTAMERYKTLSNLRTKDIVFPPNIPYTKDSNEYKLIRRMLCHDIDDRPSSEELLAHDCLSVVKLDEGEVKDMVRRTLSNPQSKDYKFLVASCLNQTMSAAFEATYNMSTFKSFWHICSLSIAEERLRTVFHKFGAVSFSPPLLTPGQAPKNGVSLMTNVGGVVHATVDLQMPFARYVVQNPSVLNFKRYAIEKVYKEMPVGIHPREHRECSFDIVSSSIGELMPDIEVFAVIHELLKSFPQLLRRNCAIHLNHSILITSLIQICLSSSSINVTKTELHDSFVKVLIESKSSVLLQNLRNLNLSESAINIIFQWLEIEGSLKEIEPKLDLILKDPEVISRSKIAMKQLQLIVKECDKFECPVIIKPSLFRNPSHYNGLIFEITCDHRAKIKILERCVICTGGRYDGLLEELKQKILTKDVSKNIKSVTGFTMNLENLVLSIDDDGRPALVDVLFCTLGCSVMKPEHYSLLKDLRAMNLKVYFSNTLQTLDEIQTLCDQLGAPTLLLAKGNDPGFVRIRAMGKESKSSERKLSFNEVLDYFLKPFKQDPVSLPRNVVNVPIVTFIEMVNVGNMKIYKTQILDNLSGVVQRLSNNVRVEVIALTVKDEFIRFISSWVELDDPVTSLEPVLKRFPPMKKLILKISKHIEDVQNTHPRSVMIFYSLIDNTYKVVM